MVRILILISLLASTAHAREIKKYTVTPLVTFQDDREVKKLNENLRKLTEFGIVDRDFNVRVASFSTISTITFVTEQVDTNYGIFALTNWDSRYSILSKATTGFSLLYGAPVTTDQKLDWAIGR